MKFDDIYQYFHSPPPHYLNKEVAVCYILAMLLERESYGTHLIEQLANGYPAYRLSDTVLYSALKFLEQEGTIMGYWQKVPGRGRPRRMYYVSEAAQSQATELARLWYDYAQDAIASTSQAM
ncbi:MAG: helix-turn-helix transcriptional regulator [Spirulinaceae cyanobacterium SM2_1_0]|nr:helix-turn-helix transcriptional regulator [Spirulinaceae cyanobacterium SM2_1_0]